jgi:two-component system chemotaxis response regulator CheB
VAASNSYVVVAIAASAGGIPAIGEVLSSLPKDLSAAILIVQHLAPAHISLLPEIFGRFTAMPTMEAHSGDTLQPGMVLIAPPDRHLTVTPDGTVCLTSSERIHYVRPSADVLFESVAEAFGPRAIAVILSGAGEDGAHGAEIIKHHGGSVFAQRGMDARFFGGMPEAAIRAGVVDSVLPAGEIGPAIGVLAARQVGL